MADAGWVPGFARSLRAVLELMDWELLGGHVGVSPPTWTPLLPPPDRAAKSKLHSKASPTFGLAFAFLLLFCAHRSNFLSIPVGS